LFIPMKLLIKKKTNVLGWKKIQEKYYNSRNEYSKQWAKRKSLEGLMIMERMQNQEIITKITNIK
jgi:hypothetical protein